MRRLGRKRRRTPKHSPAEAIGQRRNAAAEECLCALTARDGAIFLNLVELLLRCDRADLCLRILRIADPQALRLFAKRRNKTIVDCILHQNPRARFAALTGVVVDAVERPGDCGIEIGIVENHRGRFAAEFQRHALEGARGRRCDALAGFRRTGKRDFVHAGMLHQQRTQTMRRTGDDVEYTFGHSPSSAILPSSIAVSGALATV